MLRTLSFFIFLALTPILVHGHGMLMDPVNRASRWRSDSSAPINYDDNGLFCGGRSVQWDQNKGKCGFCGDNYADPRPRRYELGGIFGEGKLVQSYKQGSIIPVQVLITANHLGSFQFKLCNLDVYGSESDACFDAVLLKQPNGADKYVISTFVGPYNINLKLPNNFTCRHCVLQWTWTTGNSWGFCEDGQNLKGCGPQETFRTCSDISITA